MGPEEMLTKLRQQCTKCGALIGGMMLMMHDRGKPEGTMFGHLFEIGEDVKIITACSHCGQAHSIDLRAALANQYSVGTSGKTVGEVVRDVKMKRS